MTTISYSSVIDSNLYERLRFQILLNAEESGDPKERAYPDSDGIPTIGIGINLRVSENLSSVLAEIGFNVVNPSAEESHYIARITEVVKGDWSGRKLDLQKALDEVMAQRAANGLRVGADGIPLPTEFKLGDLGQIISVFNNAVGDAEAAVNTWISGIPDTRERLALVSLAYNNPTKLLGSKLKLAIESGNRADAWYEIRYQSNGGSNPSGGIAKRRYYESEVFGLYDEGASVGTISRIAVLQVYTMYTANKAIILQYERDYGDGASENRRAQANDDYQLGGGEFEVQSLKESFSLASGYLLSEFGNSEINVDYRDIQVAYDGNENLTGHTREGFVLGTGQEQNDLLIGSDNANILEGGAGDDILVGLGGDDTLIGGTGKNILKGGVGFDTYIFTDEALADGALDVIEDSDGSGQLIIDGVSLDLSTLKNTGSNTWTTDDGEVQVFLRPPPSINSVQFVTQAVQANTSQLFISITHDGSISRIGIDNFQNGSFGITLPDFEDLVLPNIATSNTVNGTSDDDSNLSGTAANDAINGGGGNDSIDGLGGDDVIDAGAGDDGVDGGAGDDHIMGGDGEDSLLGNNGNDVIEGGAGFDWILGEAGDDMLFANAAEDYNTILDSDGVTPGTDNDWLNADVGNDLLVGSNGNNGLSGGEGNDRLYGGAGDDVLFGDQYWNARSTWSMTIEQNADGSISPVFVDAWTNTLGEPGPGGNDILIGGAGDDYLSGDRGSDVLDGGIGNDLILGGSGEDTIMAGDGDDRVYGDDLYINVTTPDGNGGLISEKRYLYDEHGADIIDGGGGQDELYGYGGDDILTGGEGNDTLYGDGSEEHLPGQYHGDDQLDGGAGDDRLIGHGGNDRLIGGDGNDTLAGDAIESDLAGEFHGDDYLEGGAGEDILAGLGGDDTLYGGDGNDLVDGDANVAELAAIYHGNDTLYGGRGEDTLWGSGGSDELHGGEDNDRLEGDAPDVAGEYHGEDTLYGDAGDDTILGGGAGDRLFGGDGNDQILGDDFAGISEQYHGDDYIDGGSGEDVIRGNGGNDTIIGGLGVDHMGGGAGDDVYILNVGDSFYDPAGLIEVIDDQEGVNTIRFGVGITADDVTAQVWDDNLQLSFGSNDSVWLQGGANGNAVSQFEFADGSELNWSEFFGRAYKTPLDLASGDFGASLFGGAGDDSLLTFGGHSLISGGAGNDTLGGAGGDIFLFSAGDGADLISESGLDANAPNIVRFGAGVSRDMLSFAMQGNDLLVRVGFGTGDSLLIQNFRTDTFTGATTINRFEFQDGSSLSYAEVRDEQGFVYIGGDAAESQSGTASTDRMLGLGGNDVLDSGGGDDFLAGGAGDDVMRGGAGYDSYYVGNFEGIDRIEEVDDGSGNELQFGYGITPDNLSISTTEAGDLVFSLPNAGQLTVVDGFGSDGVRHISNVLFQEGTEWSAQDILAHYLSGASDGDDYLHGTRADDTLAGGKGNDTLVGDEGNDLYLYNSGDGADTIIDIAGFDTLRFGEGLIPDDWTIASNGQDLLIRHVSGTDEITIQGWFVDPANEIERVEFADGTVWESADIVAGLANQVGTAGDDVLVAPYSLNSNLSGLAGNDVLTGGSGNDTLDGGAGNDLLEGGAGNDTYLFDAGYGSDVLEDTGGIDQLIFGETIAPEALSATRDGLDVVIAAIAGTDTLRITNWFADNGGSHQIESVLFADGTQWSGEEITLAALTQIGDANNNTLNGLDGYDDKLFGLGGSDILNGGSGDDTLVGGTDDDSLFGGLGDDRYVYNNGDGSDQISDTAGVDSLVFGAGITRDAVSWERIGDNLRVSVGPGDITVSGWFSEPNGAAQLERFEFADGQVVTADEINQPWLTLTGTENDEELRGTDALNETILGLSGADHLLGLAGDDQLFGGEGNDLLEGGDGADALWGEAGDDSLVGGSGSDVLNGGAGNDTQYGEQGSDVYVYASGDGSDLIYDSEGAEDVLRFSDLNQDDLSIARNLADLAITVLATNETITLRNWFVGGGDRIEALEFVDGTSLRVADIDAMFAITLGTEGDDNLVGDDGVNMLYGLGGNDTLHGLAGDDFLDGGSGINDLYGGSGDDTYVAGTGSIHELQGEGVDTLLVTEGNRSYTLADNVENGLLVEGISDNTLIGNGLDNNLTGNSQAQTLNGGIGADTMIGGRGDDIYYIDNAGDTVIERVGGGYDTAYTSIDYTLVENLESAVLTGNATILYGNTGDNYLTGNSLDNTLYGYSGNDVLWGASGLDVLVGGSGDDRYHIDDVNDQVIELADEGTDSIDLYAQSFEYTVPDHVEDVFVRYIEYGLLDVFGNAESNTIDTRYASAPSPIDLLRFSLHGGSGDDALFGNHDWDHLYGGEGNDLMVGGDGGDWYYVDSIADQIIEYSWHGGTDIVYSSVDYTLSEYIEELWLQGDSLRGVGNDQDNYISGTGGDDTLIGGAGNDRLEGGNGDDTYIFEVDIDTIFERAGKKAGTDTVLSALDYTLASNLENLTLTGSADINAVGNELNNILIGNTGNNILDGGAGKDSMAGGAGNDTYIIDESRESITEFVGEGIDTVIASQSHKLDANIENLELSGTGAIDGTGNELDNWLVGNSSDNTLNGNEGNDHLIGGNGMDVLSGGVGSDTYYFGRGDSSDQITDQHSAKGKGPAPENYDVLQFGGSIGEDQLWFTQDSSNLIVSVIGTNDQVTINNWYRKDDFHIEEFRTSNGLYLLDSQVDNLVSAMANFAPPPPGQTTLSEDYRTQLEPVISSNWQS